MAGDTADGAGDGGDAGCQPRQRHGGGAGHFPEHGHGRGDVVADQEFWNERYSSHTVLWSADPNPQLVAEASDLAPGAALDAGCGEGADAVWLATRGWGVTAVDFSTIALERGAARAREAGPEVAGRIEWRHEDLNIWVPEEAAYDLVSSQFMHLSKDLREPLFARLAAAVAPGGCLLIVGHDPSDLQTTVARPTARDLFYTASEAAGVLDPQAWRVVVNVARKRNTTGPDGGSVTVHDAVLRAQRTG